MATLSEIGITAKVTDLAIYVTGLTIFAHISIMPVFDTLLLDSASIFHASHIY
ncbi:MAG: hypothetical protein ACK5C4_11640 [Pseudanabaena sp.]